MDDGKGRFVPALEEAIEKLNRGETVKGVFHIGQVVEVNGSRFRVDGIKRKRLVLKLLPRCAADPSDDAEALDAVKDKITELQDAHRAALAPLYPGR